jgi:HAD superfamily hydrolase (TIGR01509 family)
MEIIGAAHRHWTELLEDAIGEPLAPGERERLTQLRRERHAEALEGLHAQPGVADLMEEATRPACPARSGPRPATTGSTATCGTLGLRHHISAIVTRDAVGTERCKPHPDIFLLAAERLGADPSGCVVLEDSPNGVAAARAAGMAVVAVPAGITATLDFPPADLVVRSPIAEAALVRLADLGPPSR